MSLSLRRPWLLLVAFLLGGLAAPESIPAAMEHKFLFFPSRELVMTPAAAGLSFEDVRFAAADGVVLHGWYVPGEKNRPLVLFFHGNAGNISHRVENLGLLRQKLGVSIFIFDYRGYGLSGGRADEEGLYQDARGALAWLKERGWKPERMVYFGRSLGAGVAVQLATEAPPAGIVLETPFPSVAAMGRHHYPFLYLLLGWALNARFDSAAKIDRLHAPLLLFQGDRDAIVPPRMSRKLFDRANEPKTFHLIRGAGHNNTYEIGGQAYWQAWRDFLRRIFPPDSSTATGGSTP